jgi:hypothetical protein
VSVEHEFPANDLDAILAAAAGEIGDRLRDAADINAALSDLMAAGAEHLHDPDPPQATCHNAFEATGSKATSIIAIRAKVRELRRDFVLVWNLDQAREHDRLLERPRDSVRDLVHDDLRGRNLARARDIVCALDLAGASTGIVDRADDLVRALTLDRDMTEAIARARTLVRLFGILDALALRNGEYAEVLNRFRVTDRVQEIARILHSAYDVDSPLDQAVELIPVLDQVREIKKSIDHVLTQAEDIVGSISQRGTWRDVLNDVYELERQLTQAYPPRPTGALVTELIDDLISDLEMVDIDVSGLDLHHLDLQEVDVLTGVLWSVDTIWPINIAEDIRARSHEISPGVFRVTGPWTERQVKDHSTPSH